MMEEKFGGTLAADAMEFEGWKGYEFWSAQLEAREESADYRFALRGKYKLDGSPAVGHTGSNDAYPF